MDAHLKGKPIIPGEVSGKLLISSEPLSFWGGYDHETGKIIDKRHPLSGELAAGKVLALPFTRGSSTTTAVLLESVRAGTAPLAILTTSPDSFFALASIVAGEMYARPIPLLVLDRTDFERLSSGQWLEISEDGRIELGA
jgi:predicted aconitase with swiveling domain